jgi:adenine-specific DNA-methyltransferase
MMMKFCRKISIFHAVKKDTKNGHGGKPAKVLISSSAGPDHEDIISQEVEHEQLVRPDDPDSFIHIVLDELGHSVAQHMGTFTTTLDELGLKVSTGSVVDFRAKDGSVAKIIFRRESSSSAFC